MNDDNKPHLVYQEDISKTFQGGLKCQKLKPKVVTCYKQADLPKRCQVTLYQKYIQLCPSNHPDDAFYLKPLTNPKAIKGTAGLHLDTTHSPALCPICVSRQQLQGTKQITLYLLLVQWVYINMELRNN